MAAMSSISQKTYSLWERLFAAPPGASRDEERLYNSAGVVLALAWLVYFFYIFLFAYWGVWLLVVSAIFSVLILTVVLFVSRQQRYALATWLGAAINIISNTLVIIFIGWGLGAQYTVLTVFMLNVINPWYKRRFVISINAVYTLLFIGWYYYSLLFPPLYTAPPLQLAFFNIINIVTQFVVIGAITMDLLSETDRANQANEDLLNNVLPKSIVGRLKLKNSKERMADPNKMRADGIAESFSAVSILFADIVGFTRLSEQLTPQDTVDLLDEVFTIYDGLAEKYGVEKIRTIGDGYMVAAGAPVPLADHAHALASMALEMQSYMAQRELMTSFPFQVRIGINSGPAVGGIVGTTRFHYDLWGDMVNTAARMESHGVPGKIQIARPTYELIKDDFYCEPRGLIEIKGKGAMEAWFVTGAKSALLEKGA